MCRACVVRLQGLKFKLSAIAKQSHIYETNSLRFHKGGLGGTISSHRQKASEASVDCVKCKSGRVSSVFGLHRLLRVSGRHKMGFCLCGLCCWSCGMACRTGKKRQTEMSN